MIRHATGADLPEILEIGNHEIRTGVALWNDTPATLDDRIAWLAERRRLGMAVLVVEQAGRIEAYGAYGPFRPHEGFRHTVEHSLYVAPDCQRRGHGSALLAALIAHATDTGRQVMIGAIEAGNAASLALHAAHGFIALPPLPRAGTKFGRWLDLVFVHRQLAPTTPGPRP